MNDLIERLRHGAQAIRFEGFTHSLVSRDMEEAADALEAMQWKPVSTANELNAPENCIDAPYVNDLVRVYAGDFFFDLPPPPEDTP